MKPSDGNSRDKRRADVAKTTLAEMAQRFELAKPECVSFREKDDYEKMTRRICLGARYKSAFSGLSRLGRITLAPDGQLVLVAMEVWQEYLARCAALLSRTGFGFIVEDLERNSEPVFIDDRGRFRISEELANEVGFQNKVKLFHVGGVIELWNPETYRHHRAEAYSKFLERRFSVTKRKWDNLQSFSTDGSKT
jgi:DNA-binding transcriptional regulator/RsmH inhibitor MraZ